MSFILRSGDKIQVARTVHNVFPHHVNFPICMVTLILRNSKFWGIVVKTPLKLNVTVKHK